MGHCSLRGVADTEQQLSYLRSLQADLEWTLRKARSDGAFNDGEAEGRLNGGSERRVILGSPRQQY